MAEKRKDERKGFVSAEGGFHGESMVETRSGQEPSFQAKSRSRLAEQRPTRRKGRSDANRRYNEARKPETGKRRKEDEQEEERKTKNGSNGEKSEAVGRKTQIDGKAPIGEEGRQNPENPKLATVENAKGKRRKRREGDLSLEELEVEEFVFYVPKEKRSQKFPDDEYYCRACNLHLKDDGHCKRHFGQRSHERHVKTRKDLLMVKSLPEPTEPQLFSLSHLLEDVYQQNGVHSEEDLKTRRLICAQINDLMKPKLPHCEVFLYGSSLNGFGLRESDVNLYVQLTKASKMGIAPAMMIMMDIFQSSDLVQCVKSDFDDILPRIFFVHKKTAIKCEVCAGRGRKSIKMTGFLLHLSSLDRRACILGVALRLWAKLCQLDQPRNCSLPSVSFPLMAIFFLQQCQPPVLPVLNKKGKLPEQKTRHGSQENEEEDDMDDFKWDDVFEQKKSWRSENKECVGSLWLKLLKFYLVDVDIEQILVCITEKKPVERESRGIPNRRIAIEDPFLPKKNFGNTLNSQRVFEYFLQRLRQTFVYFGQKPVAPIDHSANIEKQPGENVKDLATRLSGIVLDNAQKEILLEKEMYQFEASVFCGQSNVPPACCLCRYEGHFAEQCPEEMPIELGELPPLTKRQLRSLDIVCHQVVDDLASTEREERQRHHVLKEVENFVCETYEGCKLALFGSSRNGFGFRNSDMDICMTHPTEKLDAEKVVMKLSKKFKSRRKEYRDILPIPSARIPIVKFIHDASGLEGDISLDNLLAQRNTAMLRLYCRLDERVKTLGYCIKTFAKLSEIGDAARGSISSYAYILMVLHYLQRTNPPVIPCLQEIYEGDDKPEVECEGWNSYYCDNLQLIEERWGKSKNKKSAGELWLGLLRYYCEEFDFRKMVVSPKQLTPLTKFEKNWAGRPLAIEDPFKLTHNLGGGVTRKMRKFIMECFAHARALFGNEPSLQASYDLCDYYFNPIVLTGNRQPPSDKSCRDCGQYGHFAADCPNKNDRKGRSKRVGHNQRQFYRHLKQKCRSRLPPNKETAFFESLLSPQIPSKSKEMSQTAVAPVSHTQNTPKPGGVLQLVPDQVVRQHVLSVAAASAQKPTANQGQQHAKPVPPQTQPSQPDSLQLKLAAEARPTLLQQQQHQQQQLPFPHQQQLQLQLQLRPPLPPQQQQQQTPLTEEQYFKAWHDYYHYWLNAYRHEENHLSVALKQGGSQVPLIQAKLAENATHQQITVQRLKECRQHLVRIQQQAQIPAPPMVRPPSKCP